MHAWLCENPVGVDALTWKELPTPQPGKGQVLIRIQAASLNFPDLLIVQNKYQMKPELPFVPGMEGAGTIHAIGADVTNWKPGDRVIFGIPATNLATKGDSITFSTPTIEGTILRRNKLDGNGKHPWKAEVTEGDTDVAASTITGWYTEVYEPAFAAAANA